MSPRALLLPFAGALLLGGCVTARGPSPYDLTGRTLRVETGRGQVSTLQFGREGRVMARFGARSIEGRWQLVERNLCFFWSGAPRECWPYRQPFLRGQTRTLTSDRGNAVRVTAL